MSVWFVTGASRGLGAEIVRAALKEGHQVAATARSADTLLGKFPDSGEQLLALPLDVTDPCGIETAVAATVAQFGRIDVLVNNAGRGLLCAVEEADDAAVRAVYETNVFGLLAVQRAVLPFLRKQRSGHIINMSSIAAFGGLAGWGVYAQVRRRRLQRGTRRRTRPSRRTRDPCRTRIFPHRLPRAKQPAHRPRTD